MEQKNHQIQELEDKIYEGKEPYIFVSYKRDQGHIVYPIIKRLIDRYGVRIWYDKNLERTGEENFENVIEEKVINSACVLFFESVSSIKSQWCGREVMKAYKDNKILALDLKRADIDVIEIPPFLEYVLGQKQKNSLTYSSEDTSDPNAFDVLNEVQEAIVDNLFNFIKTNYEAVIPSLERDGEIIKRCHDHRTEIDLSVFDESKGEVKAKKIGRYMGEDEDEKGAFEDCKNLRKINLGSIEEIGKEAFKSCESLEELVIPESVRYIGEYAFQDCKALKRVKFKGTVDFLDESIFDGCARLEEVILPDDISDLPSGMFNGCEDLKSICIPSSVVTLGERVFAGCRDLTEIDLPKNLQTIDDQAFEDCTSLKKIMIPDSVRKMGKDVFKDCNRLERVSLGRKLQQIGKSPFRGCSKLKSINVPKENKTFRTVGNDKSEEGILFDKNRATLICFPAKFELQQGSVYEIPDSVTTISEWAFAYCDNLEELKLSDSIDVIKENAFYRCSKITEIDIPEGVNSIDDMVFKQCEKLRKVTLPASVGHIGWGVFNGCKDVEVKYLAGSYVAKKLERIRGGQANNSDNEVKFETAKI